MPDVSRSIYPLIDRILGGTLAERLAEWEAEGLSPAQMSNRLYEECAIDVSYRTIYRWLAPVEPEMDGAA